MAIDPSQIQTFTDQDILNALRMAMVNSALVPNYTVNGRSIQRMNSGEIQSLIREYEWRIYRANNGEFQAGAFRSIDG